VRDGSTATFCGALCAALRAAAAAATGAGFADLSSRDRTQASRLTLYQSPFSDNRSTAALSSITAITSADGFAAARSAAPLGASIASEFLFALTTLLWKVADVGIEANVNPPVGRDGLADDLGAYTATRASTPATASSDAAAIRSRGLKCMGIPLSLHCSADPAP